MIVISIQNKNVTAKKKDPAGVGCISYRNNFSSAIAEADRHPMGEV